MNRPIRTLHVDIEGGRGGSSRSLYQLISRLDRSRVEPIVAYRETGPLEDWYKDLGIRIVHVPEIGSYVPRTKNSAKIFAASLPRLLGTNQAARRLLEIAEENDVEILHLNYEGLFLLAARLRQLTSRPMICHVRAHLPINAWSRWLVRKLSRAVDHYFFISPQEEERVRQLEAGRLLPGQVLWNIAPQYRKRVPFDEVKEAVYLGNIDWSKGTDRLIDVAAALKKLSVDGLKIAIYGEPRRARPAYFNQMNARVQSEGLSGLIEFRGFTSEPETVLSKAFALIRPSRERDPWGRDVIEATSFGVPVLATGDYGGVVDSGVTGFLVDPFDASTMAAKLKVLLEDETLCKRMSAAAISRGETIFSGQQQVAQFTSVLEKLRSEDV